MFIDKHIIYNKNMSFVKIMLRFDIIGFRTSVANMYEMNRVFR